MKITRQYLESLRSDLQAIHDKANDAADLLDPKRRRPTPLVRELDKIAAAASMASIYAALELKAVTK